MNIEYTGRNTTISPKWKHMADAELGRIDKMLGRTVGAHVIFTEDKYRQCVEVTLVAANETLVATNCEDTDMLVALHDALKKIESQAIKHKERRMTVERQRKPNSTEPLIELAEVPQAAAVA
jgi:putative sigma-54 modulation protein